MSKITTIISNDNGYITERVYEDGLLVKDVQYIDGEFMSDVCICDCEICETIRDYAEIFASIEFLDADTANAMLHDFLQEICELEEYIDFEQDEDFCTECGEYLMNCECECDYECAGECEDEMNLLTDEELDAVADDFYSQGYQNGYLACLNKIGTAIMDAEHAIMDLEL